MTFYLFGTPDEELRLKSFSSTSRGARSVIRIEIETSSPWRLGSTLEALAEIQKGQCAKPEKPRPKARPLALPPPPDISSTGN